MRLKQLERRQDRESALKPFVPAANQMSDGFSVTVARAVYPKNAVGGTSHAALYPGGKVPSATQQAFTGTDVTILVASS